MDSKNIEQLLERYWNCETSVEEEAQLHDYFLQHHDLPARLLPYKDWFDYRQQQQEIRLDNDFDARILARIEAPVVVKAKRMSLLARFMPLFRAAAAVALILLVSHLVQHSFLMDDGHTMVVADTIGRQISAPSVALSGTGNAAACEQQILDSLRQMEEVGEEE